MRHLSTDSQHGLASDLQQAINTQQMDTVALVQEFETACGATLTQLPVQPSVEKLKLRLSLELEELYEKAQAMGLEGSFQDMLTDRCINEYSGIEDTNIYDPVALLDACCDQRYVQDGTVLTCGLDKVFYPAFAEVHRSNMSKFPATMNDAVQTSLEYKRQGVDTTWGASGPKWVVRRATDGKILKALQYSPANLSALLEEK